MERGLEHSLRGLPFGCRLANCRVLQPKRGTPGIDPSISFLIAGTAGKIPRTVTFPGNLIVRESCGVNLQKILTLEPVSVPGE